MSISPWVPYLGSSAIMVLGICLAVLLIPETFPTTKRIQSQDQNDHATTPLLQDPQDDLAPSPGNPHKESYKLAEAGPWIKRNVAVILIISCFFVSELGKQVAGVLLQYTSKKFHWNYAKASYLISLRAGVNLLVLTVIIPTLSGLFLGRLKMSPALKDKRLTQISGVLLVTGCMTIFLAVSPPILILGQVVFALGFAFSVTARSLVTSLVEQKLLGTIYTSISVLTYSGILVGGPLLASSFQWGMQLREEFWMGMPFVVAAGLFMLALIAVSAVNLHSRKDSGT
jgi:MFS family permease